MFKSLSNEPDRFQLRLGPDGVYRVDGRVVGVRDETARLAVFNFAKRLSDMKPGSLGGEQ